MQVGFGGAVENSDNAVAGEKNPFTPKAFYMRYWDKKIHNDLPKPAFLPSKASPLSAAEPAVFAKLAATNSLHTRLPQFCSSAHLLCVPELGASLEKHSKDVNFAVYQGKNTNYGTDLVGGVNSFKNYSRGGGATLRPSQSFFRFSENANAGEQLFTSYWKNGNRATNEFTKYSKHANVIGSGFTNYDANANIENDTFTSYRDQTNSPVNDFKSYGDCGNAVTEKITNYRVGENIGQASFKSYAKNSNAAQLDFTNYGNSSGMGSGDFTGYGKRVKTTPRTGFKGLQFTRSLHGLQQKGVIFAQYE